MKKFITLFCFMFSSPIFGQITLEHTYDEFSQYYYISIAQIDSNEQVYVCTNGTRIDLYNLDHTLRTSMGIPKTPNLSQPGTIWYITKRLFALDDKIEYLVMGSYPSASYRHFIRVFNEVGDTVFSIDSCKLGSRGDQNFQYEGIYNTSNGTKLLLTSTKSLETKSLVYSLPGKLPTSNTKLSVTDASMIISGSGSSLSAYPNPSDGKIRVSYTLPEGVSSGELVITSTDGREVKRYRVGNMFNDILIEKSELPSGAYFYKLITERGESEARKFVITN